MRASGSSRPSSCARLQQIPRARSRARPAGSCLPRHGRPRAPRDDPGPVLRRRAEEDPRAPAIGGRSVVAFGADRDVCVAVPVHIARRGDRDAESLVLLRSRHVPDRFAADFSRQWKASPSMERRAERIGPDPVSARAAGPAGNTQAAASNTGRTAIKSPAASGNGMRKPDGTRETDCASFMDRPRLDLGAPRKKAGTQPELLIRETLRRRKKYGSGAPFRPPVDRPLMQAGSHGRPDPEHPHASRRGLVAAQS